MHATKHLARAVTGVIVGSALTFILIALTIVTAIIRDESTNFPGVFYAELGTENSALALTLKPNSWGILSIVIITSVVFLVRSLSNSKSRT